MTKETITKYCKEYTTQAEDIEALEKKLKALKAERDKLKAKIVAACGEKATVSIGAYEVTTWTQTRQNVDLKALIAERPEVFEAYKKPETISQYCNVKRK